MLKQTTKPQIKNKAQTVQRIYNYESDGTTIFQFQLIDGAVWLGFEFRIRSRF